MYNALLLLPGHMHLLFRLWETLVEGALVQHDKDVAFLWFCNVLQEGRSVSGAAEHSWAIIDKNSSQMLLTQKMAKLDPATLSKDGYHCFASYFNVVGLLCYCHSCLHTGIGSWLIISLSAVS